LPKIRIEFLIAIEDYILMVYYSSIHGYQFPIVDEIGIVYELDEIFYTADAALIEGKTAITAMLHWSQVKAVS
jgi:hypothetical protein